MAGSKQYDDAAPLVSTRRKREVLGLILVVLGFLLSLAFITYNASDNAVVRSAPLLDALLNPGAYQAELAVQNALGLLGAELARLLIPGFLGYMILMWCGLWMVWGYAVFRNWPFRPLLYPTLLVGVGSFVTAGLVGWFGQALNADFARWAGAVGIGLAGWMRGVFGTPGSLILLLLGVAVMTLLVVDRDLQRSMDRVVDALRVARNRLRSWWVARQDRSSPVPDDASAESLPSDGRPMPPTDEPATAQDETPVPRNGPTPPSSLSDAPSPPSRPSPSSRSSSEAGADPNEDALRRNDLFREPDADENDKGSPPQNEGPPSASDPEPTTTNVPESSASPGTESDLPSSPPERDDEAKQEPDAEETPPDDVELTVKERVEEEKADEIERPAETPEQVEYESPPLDLLDEATDQDPTIDRDELEQNKRILLDKLDTYDVEIQDLSAVVGPTVTRYELTPAPGIKVSRIKSLEDDLAMALAAPSIRIIAPIPGKTAVGVEIPNRNRELVRLRDVIGTAKFRDTDMALPIPMGKSIEGEVHLADLTTMPHLLIAGATGSGKSVGLNALITGLIYACHPMNLRFVIIDPKKIELQQYTALQTQFVAQPEDVDQTVITDLEEASGVLKSVEKEMEERYELLSDANVRGIEGYNKKFKAGALDPTEGHRHMPYLVVVVDELADLMMAAGDDIEGPISRLAQMARAVGIHLVLATQRPSVDVITGVIKANFPSRIAYEVASMADSRTILDQGGAEGLVGNGDMLFLSGSDLRRLQGPFVSVDEVERVVDFVSEQPGVTPYTLPSLADAGHGPDETLGVEDTDDKFEEAARVIVRRQQGSVSLLQRKLAVGYTRAARIVDQLEEAGIVGPFNGTKAREVLVDDEEELDRLLHGDDEDEDAEAGSSPDAE